MSQSSTEDDNVPGSVAGPQSTTANKKRRVQSQRACDRCRQKKIRCDGNPSGSKCSHCMSSDSSCVFTESTKTRGPPKRYVDSLETRLEKMEGMLSRLYPDGDFSQEMDFEGWARNFQTESTEDHQPQQENGSSSTDPPRGPPTMRPPRPSGSYSDDSAYDSDNDPSALQPELAEYLKMACHDSNRPRYFGKSSGITLLRTAMNAKSKASGQGQNTNHREAQFQRRPEFWCRHPWELERIRVVKHHYEFPEPDLLTSLIALYFKHVAPIMPLLHRPTFLSAFDDCLHLRDDKFGALVLLVCAVASRYSHDPRAWFRGGDSRPAGWIWFNQVEPFSRAVLCDPELYDLQTATLAAMYAHGTLPPHESWVMVGIGLRLAQDAGAHRRRSHGLPPTVEDELWKRAFWVLLMLDIWTSSYLGRPCAISEENYDVEYPIECDDEYWENADPALAFKQPPGKPTRVSYFNHLIKINLLHSHALRTIYSLNKSRLVTGPREKGWEEKTVTELDSALNSWFDSIPDHLRWDPSRENQTFFVQSAAMHIAYYFIQITIHRPFIPSFHKESALSFPALAICASAARALSHISDALRIKHPALAAPNIHLPTFVAGVIILLSLWGAKRSGTTLDAMKEMEDVRKCLKVLEAAESRWSVAGRLRDMLINLSAAGDIQLPAGSPPSNKRDREDSDGESPKSPLTPQIQNSTPHRSLSMSSATYPIAQMQSSAHTQSRHRASTQSDAESPDSPVSTSASPVASTAVGGPDLSGLGGPGSLPARPPVPKEPVNAVLPQPYRGSYVPLGGSSGLGRASRPPVQPKSSASSPFGGAPSPPGTAEFVASPTTYTSQPLPLSAGLDMSNLHVSFGASASHASHDMVASASASTSSGSSPLNGFQQGVDFSGGSGATGTGVFDMSGVEFGGYGVPLAEQEAMLRCFAPVPQDGQIGVDRDTMMMWSTMPSSFEYVIIYFPSPFGR
ncbi:fungal-specific transcription factor domain-containing protein [Gloeopeniophorella convolvens]|nr:fungal-specific transcription factor domain-containing protein [Gloeopeniophorella convolvens]